MRGVLLLLGAIQLLVAFTPATRWWLEYLTGPWGKPEGSAMVVLGGEQIESGFIGRSSYWRAFYASHLWKRGHFSKILLSGGGDPAVAVQMKQLLRLGGVPDGSILLETKSESTRENAIEAARVKWAAGDVIVLVSSDFHMRRATGAFRRAGLKVTPCPAPDGIKQYLRITGRWSLALELAQETVKLVYYRLRGWA